MFVTSSNIEVSEEERNSREFLVETINDVLEESKDDKPLFRNLLRSFRPRSWRLKMEDILNSNIEFKFLKFDLNKLSTKHAITSQIV